MFNIKHSGHLEDSEFGGKKVKLIIVWIDTFSRKRSVYVSFSDDSVEEDLSDAETVVMANNDVANVEDVANEDDFSASLEEVSFPLELAIEEIKSMSVSVPQIITID